MMLSAHAITQFFALYFRPRMLVIFALGFASGLPLALTAGTLSAWLADAKIDRAAIGLFAAVATPYAFKFVWAPLIDALRLPVLAHLLGRRRSWMLLTQVLLVASLLAMAGVDPAASAGLTALCAVVVATLSATQDIVIDAFRVESLPLEEQGAGAAAATFGYRIGMLVSGAGALALAELYGWHMAYVVMAGAMAACVVVTLCAKEGAVAMPQPRAARRTVAAFFKQAVVAPFADFTTRPLWAHVLVFVILYKLGDAFMGVMFNPFLLEIGFTKLQIATIVKFYGLWATIAGAFAGGYVVARLGMYRSLLICGFFHMITNLLMVVQAELGANTKFLTVSIVAENFSGGMSTTAFIAYLGALTRTHYTATQYALLSSFAAFGRTWLSTPSGWVAEAVGWHWFFAISCLIALPSLGLLVWMEAREKQRRNAG